MNKLHTQNIKNVTAFVLNKDYYGLHNLCYLTNLKAIYVHFILNFKVMHLNARGRAVRPKHVAYIDETNKICCCCWRQYLCEF